MKNMRIRFGQSHPNEGLIRAYLDQALSVDQAAEINAHLLTCSSCRAAANEIQNRAESVQATFIRLDGESEQIRSSASARIRFNQRLEIDKENQSMKPNILSRIPKAAWAALAVTIVLVVALTFEPVRAFANSFLALFRVEQIRVIEFDSQEMDEKLKNSSQLEYILSNQIQVEETGELQQVSSPEEASALAGFAVRLPVEVEGERQIHVQPAAKMNFTVDLELVRGVLKDLGREDIRLPDNLDGALVKMEIPAGVMTAYGDCSFEEELPSGDSEQTPAPMRDFKKCTTLLQIPSPAVSAPPDIDLNQIGEAYLQVLGMDAQEAASFARSVNWTTTFVVPLPRSYATYEEVQIDGTTGTLINERPGYHPGFTLMWVKDGIIYALNGPGDREAALEMAASIH